MPNATRSSRRMVGRITAWALTVCLAATIDSATPLRAADAPAPATTQPTPWTRHDQAALGPARAAAFVYAPTVGRFMAVGYQHPPGSGKRTPATYDEVAFDPAAGRWENWFPPGKDWGPAGTGCSA